MLKRFTPAIALVFSVLLDTAILPVFYNGRYTILFSLITVIAIAILRGRMLGLFYGLLAGVLLDLPAGTPGLKIIAFTAIGFIIGFLLDRQPDIYARDPEGNFKMSSRQRREWMVGRMIWIGILLLIHESVLLVMQYFGNAIMQWSYIRDLLIRAVATDIIITILFPFYHFIFIGRGNSNLVASSDTKEMTDY